MRTKGIGPNNLGMDKRNLASPAKVRMTDAEKAKMMAEKRAAGTDGETVRRSVKAEEFKKAGGGNLIQGQAGYEEAVSKAEVATDKKMRRIKPNNM